MTWSESCYPLHGVRGLRLQLITERDFPDRNMFWGAAFDPKIRDGQRFSILLAFISVHFSLPVVTRIVSEGWTATYLRPPV